VSDTGDTRGSAKNVRNLTDAIRRVRTAEAERSDVVVELRDAERARLEGALVVFGSATPRPESWHGIPRRIALPGRVGGPLPAVEVVDLRHDGGYPLTRPLRDALGRIEDSGGRAILLQNRRGSAAALHCRSCGHGWRCPRCDVSLSLHGGARLVCHHCGHSERPPRACPECGSVDLTRIGSGTRAVEEELGDLFPGLSVLRLDADVAAQSDEPDATLAAFRAADRAVLVGTQLVAKGHDVPGVTLAAVLDAETGMAMPDFRAVAASESWSRSSTAAAQTTRRASARACRP
jgi:primosomal protein N' (replication factor Y)